MCPPRDSEVSHLTNDKLLVLDRILPAEFGNNPSARLMKPSAGALLSLRSSLVAAEPLGVDLVVGTVGADFVEDLVKTGAQLVVALADGKAVVFRLQDTGHFAQVEVGGGLLSQEVLVDGLVVDDGLAALEGRLHPPN